MPYQLVVSIPPFFFLFNLIQSVTQWRPSRKKRPLHQTERKKTDSSLLLFVYPDEYQLKNFPFFFFLLLDLFIIRLAPFIARSRDYCFALFRNEAQIECVWMKNKAIFNWVLLLLSSGFSFYHHPSIVLQLVAGDLISRNQEEEGNGLSTAAPVDCPCSSNTHKG